MAEQLSVLIIGAGNKGASGPVSHAEAFTNNPTFKVVGFVDNDETKTTEAVARWGGMVFNNLDSAFECCGSIDVAVVSTPDATHEEILGQLIGRPIGLLFAEKPFCPNSKAARALLPMFYRQDTKAGTPVMVNYTRRFHPAFSVGLKEYLPFFGKFLGGTAFYTKGLHNLCHWVDTFLMLGIDPEAVRYIEIDRSKLNVFDSFLYFELGRLDIFDLGQKWQRTDVCERDDFPELILEANLESYNYTYNPGAAMDNAVQNIADYLTKGTPLLSPGENAVKVLEICERILGESPKVPHLSKPPRPQSEYRLPNLDPEPIRPQQPTRDVRSK